MKRKNRYEFLCLIAMMLLASGCETVKPETPIIETSPISFPTSTIESQPHTETPLPPPTAILISTLEPTEDVMFSGELSSPPYLVYIKKMGEKEQVVLVNQDGTGTKILSLPHNGFHAGNLSPSGEWMIFYTESGKDSTDTPMKDLSINLIHLPDGDIHKVTGLLSDDYPDNIEKIAEAARSNEPDLAGMSLGNITSGIQASFIHSLYITSWSPSGNSLAFSGEMDGPSSDLYLYDIHSSKTTRLSSGSKNIDFIRWFPDGNQILYSSSYISCMGDCSSYYVTNTNGSISKSINNFDVFGGVTFMGNWATSSSITVHTDANGSGICCLRNFDFVNDKDNMLYGGSFQAYAYDPQTDILAISIADNLENREPGTYFIDQNGMRKVDEFYSVYYLGWPDYPFILSGGSTKLLSSSGKTKPLIEQGLTPFASRNNLFVALCDGDWGQGANGLKVFNNQGDLIFEISDQNVARVIWRIDSEGLFYITNNQLYYVGIQDKTPILIDRAINSLETDTFHTSFDWER